MRAPETPANESARVRALWRLGLLDTDPEERFDRITRLAQALFDVPIALVSLVDTDRQWFKSKQGLTVSETSREVSFCGHAVNAADTFYVPDAAHDSRFADNPLVVDGPMIRFYAGCPIAAPDGSLIGTVCVIDKKPRAFTEQDFASLRDFAAIVEQELALGQLAIDDDLTGLRNRRGFEILARQAFAVCQRQRASALVLFADIDGLKVANDTHGHATGDQLLKDFADVLSASFRDADVIARVGGDEFAVFLSGSSSDPKIALDRISAAIAARNTRLAAASYPLSVSVGTAAFEERHREPLDIGVLLSRADQEMYRVKNRRGAARAESR